MSSERMCRALQAPLPRLSVSALACILLCLRNLMAVISKLTLGLLWRQKMPEFTCASEPRRFPILSRIVIGGLCCIMPLVGERLIPAVVGVSTVVPPSDSALLQAGVCLWATNLLATQCPTVVPNTCPYFSGPCVGDTISCDYTCQQVGAQGALQKYQYSIGKAMACPATTQNTCTPGAYFGCSCLAPLVVANCPGNFSPIDGAGCY